MRAVRADSLASAPPLPAARASGDVSVTPIAGADGGIEKILVVSRDVTARKQAEEGLVFVRCQRSLSELVDYDSTLQRIANLAIAGFADWCVVDVLDAAGTRRRLAVTNPDSKEIPLPQSVEAAAGVPHVLRTGEPELVPNVVDMDAATAPQGPERIARLREWGIQSYMAVPLSARGRVIGGMTFLSISPRRRYGAEELVLAQELRGG